jgi:hypothetical protein
MIRRQIERQTLIPPPEKRTCTPKSNPSKKRCAFTGARTETIHGSYFSDQGFRPAAGRGHLPRHRPTHPSVVADLGGGTGFILKELLRRRAMPGVRLVNVDNRISLFHSIKSSIGPLESRVKSESIHQPFSRASTCSVPRGRGVRGGRPRP